MLPVVGPALDSLRQLLAKYGPNSFDFAFLDADKRQYDAYYELLLQLVRPGGLICVDNVLFYVSAGTTPPPASFASFLQPSSTRPSSDGVVARAHAARGRCQRGRGLLWCAKGVTPCSCVRARVCVWPPCRARWLTPR